LPEIKQFYRTENSFGGIEGRGVSDAIAKAQEVIKNGCRWYIKSDISDFFSNIPKEVVLQKICSVVKDDQFNSLLTDALKTELNNMDLLGKYASLFPLQEIGVAQGCCLSPLCGNILLKDFDASLNGRGVSCLRYIDDFVIFGPTRDSVTKAFENGNRILECMKLKAYSPDDSSGKSSIGETANGFDFLGCNIKGELVRPLKKNRTNLIQSIQKILDESAKLFRNPQVLAHKNLSVLESLTLVSRIIAGWANHYSFCTDRETMKSLDSEISSLIKDYLGRYSSRLKALKKKEDQNSIRRLLGIGLITDYVGTRKRSEDAQIQG
jgi:hypothetical protein